MLIRQSASRLLAFVVSRATADAREWANAMRAELDGIEDDRTALLWAIGSLTSLVGHFGLRGLVSHARRRGELAPPAHRWQAIGLGTAEVLSGVAVALCVVAVAIVADLAALRISWGQFARSSLTERSLLVTAIEVVFIASVVALPRRRRLFATGITLCGLTLAIHIASHG